MLDEILAGLTALGAIGTGLAVTVGVRQLKATEREIDVVQQQAQTAFEDDLSREYRQIVGDLPVEVFYADSDVAFDERVHRSFYRYFDLSNEQLFLARQGRISYATQEQWRDGIAGNLRLPAFREAWAEIGGRVPRNYFEDLRRLIQDAKVHDKPARLRESDDLVVR
jgi:hypothetical protein